MITDLQLEALIRENARLKGDLQTIASRVSHDLRSPLGGITVTGEVLKEILQEKEPAMVSLADSLISSGDEMARLIKRVSFMAKASSVPKAKETVAMASVVSDVMQHVESLVLSKQAKVELPSSWPEVLGVMDWLKTIWMDLLTNALQHGGKSPLIKLGWNEEAGQFRFWITDSGPGVVKEAVANLFQPFNTLHQLSSTRGLGLSIVQRLVELQQGTCGYDPQHAGGTYFFFTLPK